MELQEVEKRSIISGGETRREEVNLVHDSSIDYKGRVPLRASTGVWKASVFIMSKSIYAHSLALNISLLFFQVRIMALCSVFIFLQ